jgi:four helix bundle protein
MRTENIIQTKSFQFAVRIVKLHRHLIANKVDRVLCSQILKSGTSIGANIEEAIGGSSKKDFIQKFRIAFREARETRYWLNLLKETELLEANLADSLREDCDELLRIITAIINSAKREAQY